MTETTKATDLSIPRVQFYRRADIMIGLRDAEAILRKRLQQHAGPEVIARAEKTVRDWEFHLDTWDSRD